MATGEARGGPFELIDPELTIYALANGMDLAKESDTRRLGWYRDGREREIRISTRSPEAGFVLVASAFPTGQEAHRVEQPLGEVASARDLVEHLSSLLEEGQLRANGL